MMTANEARTATNDQLTKIAKEFIWNVVSKRIQDAIDHGYFFATVSTEDLLDTNNARAAVSKILETDYGFVVDYTNGVRNEEGYFTIRWDVGDCDEN